MSKVHAHCRCGKVSVELVGPPMMRATCYCGSCQAAAKMLGVSVDGEGGTDFTLYRKDRIGQVSGTEHLRDHRLTPGSPMRRLVAECCQTPFAADFTKGHWLNFFAESLPADSRPTIRSYTAPFMAKLILSWAAMGFRRPKLTW
ncbi:MAG TPA: DUF6151 family protein [Magnetospirillaceae bacterium]|nr:DUF6151 family protein [Magnetospirillaceae bacterium]